jgi:ketosteroid isomerase-like protein
MNSDAHIDLAKDYVAQSNTHDLSRILRMFHDTATYTSPHVGQFSGREEIGEMMKKFFDAYPDVEWEVAEYHKIGDAIVEFEFLMRATEAETGDRIERDGIERIEFTEPGLISHVAIRRP